MLQKGPVPRSGNSAISTADLLSFLHQMPLMAQKAAGRSSHCTAGKRKAWYTRTFRAGPGRQGNDPEGYLNLPGGDHIHQSSIHCTLKISAKTPIPRRTIYPISAAMHMAGPYFAKKAFIPPEPRSGLVSRYVCATWSSGRIF